MTNTAEQRGVSQEDILRADLYDFLAALLAAPPAKDLLKRTASLTGDDETEMGKAIAGLSRVAQATSERSVASEYNRLFIGLGRGELVPYTSFYMTGFLNEKPLAELRNDMAQLGLERSPNKFEPEDNIASLCEIMASLIRGRFGEPAELGVQKDFFNRHIAPWAGHFFSDLEGAQGSVFYAPVGTVGRLFVDIEREAFRMAGGRPVN